MSFWKNLFTPSLSTNGSGPAVANGSARRTLDGAGAAPPPPRIFLSNNRDIDLYELEELCDAVGWARRPIRKVKKAIQHSFLVVTMWREQGNYRRLIGFARATSDHTFNATVWDVVLHPDYQNKGLGKALMQRVIDDLRSQDISNITLFADPDVVGFYEHLGFNPDPDGIKGMFWYPDS
ncbi:GNAT family N-acetyltransferase [Synechococcus sp. PCC 7336]|uniref:GNAT family N-acetyltransferase n=1 Tax=Synechococcus sp. PCC 7336 TaxID=195250 RepID=UPI00034AC5AB|nr:GNAT family N-acetyltransferase [Synechococcus sp. PCC 7336]